MYQALYRKWRPKTFDEVVGQEAITTTLKNELAQGRFSHAYLLMGSRGTGKTTCAKLIAKAVNCLNPVDGSPCGECEICKGIDNGSVMDVLELDAASYNGVDNIRELREEAMFQPSQAKFRVYIIDEAHALSGPAVQALLKILEEPPAHVIFILATTEIHKMPATIVSRCQRFDFKRIDSEVIVSRLSYICSQESIQADDESLQMIARIADGGMRDALSILDLCVAHSKTITPQTVVEVSGMVGQDYLFEFTDCAIQKNLGGALNIINEVGANVEYERLTSQLITHYRNLMCMLSSKSPEKLIVCLPETLKRYQDQARSIKLSTVINSIKILRAAQSAMTRSPIRKTELEIAAMQLCEDNLNPSAEKLLERIEDLEAKINLLSANGVISTVAAEIPSKTTVEVQMPTAPSIEKEAPKEAKISSISDVPSNVTAGADPGEKKIDDSTWQDIVQRLKKNNPAIAAQMTDSSGYISGGHILIDSPTEVLFDLIRESETTRASIKTAIAEVLGVKYAIGPHRTKKETAADPLIKLANTLKGSNIPINIED